MLEYMVKLKDSGKAVIVVADYVNEKEGSLRFYKDNNPKCQNLHNMLNGAGWKMPTLLAHFKEYDYFFINGESEE